MMSTGGILDFSYGAMNGVIAVILAITAVVSVIQCFFGYKIFKFWVGVIGFIVFVFLGGVLGALAFKGSEVAIIIFGLICGILGAFLAMKLYKLGVFIQCFGTGFLVGIVLCGAILQTDIGPAMALAIVFGAIFGIVGVILIKPVIIISTGFSGGVTLGLCLAGLFKGNLFLGILLGIISSICGVLYQFYSSKNPKLATNGSNSNIPVSSENNNISLSNENSNVTAMAAIGVPTEQDPDEGIATDISQNTNIGAGNAINPIKTENKPNEFVEDAKKKVDEMKIELQKKIQHKIDTDSKEVSEEDSRAAALYMFKGIESFVYSNKIMKTIMPFIEYALYIITGIFFIKGLFSRNIGPVSMITTIVLGAIILLCLVKGKKISVSISLAVIAIFQFIGMIRLDIFRYLPAKYTFKHLLEVVIILGFAALVAYVSYSKKTIIKEEIVDKQEV